MALRGVYGERGTYEAADTGVTSLTTLSIVLRESVTSSTSITMAFREGITNTTPLTFDLLKDGPSSVTSLTTFNTSFRESVTSATPLTFSLNGAINWTAPAYRVSLTFNTTKPII